MPSSFQIGQAPPGETPARELWSAVDRLLDRASLEGILAHKLGPLGAIRQRRLERPVPDLLAQEERAASFAMLSATPLLRRILECWDRPLLLLKGPELAALYPPGGRRFGDVDILAPDAAALHGALRRVGFVEVHDHDFDHTEHHHLVPLRWPVIPLNVEVHASPNWPGGTKPPPVAELLEAAVPSVLGIDGLSAPDPCHHALVLAAHAWKHEPLQTVRDLVDVAVVSSDVDRGDLDRTAEAWGMGRIWRTTRSAADSLFFGGPATIPLRVWARHLEAVRERTVFESHLQRWLRPFWGLPPAGAIAEIGRVVRTELSPAEGETWGTKLSRFPRAVRDAGIALSERRNP
jgi:hypothetical protein